MNYYKFNIGDYAAATRHLSMLEHGAYRMLIDVYYTTEQPLPADIKASARKAGARSKDEIAAVDVVLHEFFTLTDSGWTHNRCDSEIAIFKSKAETNRVTGKLGGRPKKITQTVSSDNPEITQTVSGNIDSHNPNQEPRTSNQEKDYSEAKASGGKPPNPMPPDEIIFGYGVPLLTSAGATDKAARSFLGGLRKAHGDTAVVDKLRECLKTKPLQPLEWLAAALPPNGSSSAKRMPPPENFAAIDYGQGGML